MRFKHSVVVRFRLAVALAPLAVAAACGRTAVDDLSLEESGVGGSSVGGHGGRGGGGDASGGDGNRSGRGGDAGSSLGGASGATVGGSAGDITGGSSGAAGRAGTSGLGGASGLGGTSGLGGASGAGRGGDAGAAGRPDARCGDGIVDPGEACDPGSEPAPPALEIRQGDQHFEVLPIVGGTSATAYYDYFSASSHTGLEAALTSKIYLYRWSAEEALSLVMFHGIDAGLGDTQPSSVVSFTIQGLPSTGVVVLSDDRNELVRDTPTTALANWEFDDNTDGGIVGGLPWPGSFRLTVNASFAAGVNEWTFLSGTGKPDLGIESSIALDPALPLEIIASGEADPCSADCKLPVCGDGHLDPGEVCDDGNDLPGDGCMNCLPEP